MSTVRCQISDLIQIDCEGAVLTLAASDVVECLRREQERDREQMAQQVEIERLRALLNGADGRLDTQLGLR